MKKKYLENRYITLFVSITIFSFVSCSNKYESFRNIATTPKIITDKDTMTIRIKDYYNYSPGLGFLKITFKDSISKGMNFEFESLGNNLIVLYDGVMVNQPVPVNQYTSIYIGSEKIGIYPLTIRVINNFDIKTTKTILVKVIDGVIPVANLTATIIESSPTFAICSFDASLSSSPTSKIVLYKFYIDKHLVTSKKNTISYNLPLGTHKIGLITIDDLGKQSIITEISINI